MHLTCFVCRATRHDDTLSFSLAEDNPMLDVPTTSQSTSELVAYFNEKNIQEKVLLHWRGLVSSRKVMAMSCLLRVLRQWRQRRFEQQQNMKENRSFRAFLQSELFHGRPISTVQHNIVLLPTHEQHKLYTCTVCYADDLTLEDIFVLSCSHFLCKVCMAHYISSAIDNNLATSLTCPDPSCKEQVIDEQVRRCVTPSDYERYTNFLLQNALARDENFTWCPRPGCGAGLIRSADNQLVMRCPAERCGFDFCFQCKKSEHSGFTCAQHEEFLVLSSQSERLNAEWLAKNTRPCPKCSVAIQRNKGCLHMTCRSPGCGHDFCWNCMKPYKSGHFNSGKCKGKQFSTEFD